MTPRQIRTWLRRYHEWHAMLLAGARAAAARVGDGVRGGADYATLVEREAERLATVAERVRTVEGWYLRTGNGWPGHVLLNRAIEAWMQPRVDWDAWAERLAEEHGIPVGDARAILEAVPAIIWAVWYGRETAPAN